MKRFRLAKIREGIQAEKQTLLELAVLLAGIGAIILAVRSLPGVSFSAGVVFTGAVLICGVMYGLFTARGKWLLKGSALLLAVCGTAGIARWDLFTAQLSALCGSYRDHGISAAFGHRGWHRAGYSWPGVPDPVLDNAHRRRADEEPEIHRREKDLAAVQMQCFYGSGLVRAGLHFGDYYSCLGKRAFGSCL